MLARLVAATLVATSTGCATLGALNGTASKTAAPQAAVAVAMPVAAQAAAPEAQRTGPFPQPNEQQAMQLVAPALQQLAATDPQLHSQVLEQLATSDPSLWSLTVQRAQNTAAYKQQLAGDTLAAQPATAPSTPLKLPPATPPSQVVPASATIDNPLAQQKVAPAAVAPTAPTQVESLAPPADASLPTVVGQQQPQGKWIDNTHFASAQTNPSGEVAPPFEPAPASTVSIRPASLETDPSTPGLDEPRHWRDALDEAIALLEEAAPDRPRSTSEANEFVRLRLMQLAGGYTDEAVDAPRGLSTAEQGYWSNQLYALSTLLDDERFRDRIRRVAAAARHQSEASAKLRELGDLEVSNFVTCREVYGFGAYDPLPTARYRAGEQVVLYAEIDNYASEVTDDGHRTSLASSYRLVDERGDEAAAGDFPVVDDLCLTLRRDFHIQYGVTLPKSLAAGDYRLELSVTDQLGDKIGHSDLMLTIAGR